MKRIKRYLVLGLCMAACICFSMPQKAHAGTKGINVQYHTQAEIRNYLKNINLDQSPVYSETPSASAPYAPGALSAQTQQNAVDVLNACRYIAGIPADVRSKEEYVRLAQHGALVNAANQRGGISLSHSPAQPAGMDAAMYQLGYEGAGSSNLAAASWRSSLGSRIVYGWMDDSDSSNIDRLGHRRWCLNPSMKYTGFGMAEAAAGNGVYYDMYAFDSAFDATEYYGVAWPAQNMPIEFFKDNMAWSVSMGREIAKASVQVTLSRKRDGKTWRFSSGSADGYFNVENSGYGRKGCIIFRPNNITYSAGDAFSVSITGTELDVAYEVEFFSDCTHENKLLINLQDATCTKNGNTGDTACSKCGEILARGNVIPATGHREVEDPAVEPTCTQNGKTKGSHCSVCGQVLTKQTKINATGHKEVEDPAVEPTYTTTGKTKGSHCSVCGEIIKKQEILPVREPQKPSGDASSGAGGAGDTSSGAGGAGGAGGASSEAGGTGGASSEAGGAGGTGDTSSEVGGAGGTGGASSEVGGAGGSSLETVGDSGGAEASGSAGNASPEHAQNKSSVGKAALIFVIVLAVAALAAAGIVIVIRKRKQ